MKVKKFFLVLAGILLLCLTIFPIAIISISASGELEGVNGRTGVALGIACILIFLWFSFLCFRAARRVGKLKPVKAECDTVDEIAEPKHTPARKQPGLFSNFQVDFVLIANSTSRTKAGSAIARGVVGGALLGPVGLLAAASAKKNGYLDLIIHYKSGRVATRRVKVNSSEYRSLAPYIQG